MKIYDCIKEKTVLDFKPEPKSKGPCVVFTAKEAASYIYDVLEPYLTSHEGHQQILRRAMEYIKQEFEGHEIEFRDLLIYAGEASVWVDKELRIMEDTSPKEPIFFGDEGAFHLPEGWDK